MALIRAGLEKAKNADVTVRVFAGADHSLCIAKTGVSKEQPKRAQARKAQNAPDFMPGYLDVMTERLGKRFRSES